MPKYEAGPFPKALVALSTFLRDFPPGPRFIPWYVVVNLQKGLTLPFVFFLMSHFNNYSPAAYFYAAAHGSYGLVWLYKHFVFPDAKWATKTTLMGQVWSFLG